MGIIYRRRGNCLYEEINEKEIFLSQSCCSFLFIKNVFFLENSPTQLDPKRLPPTMDRIPAHPNRFTAEHTTTTSERREVETLPGGTNIQTEMLSMIKLYISCRRGGSLGSSLDEQEERERQESIFNLRIREIISFLLEIFHSFPFIISPMSIVGSYFSYSEI